MPDEPQSEHTGTMKSDTQTAISAGAAQGRVYDVDGHPYTVVPADYQLKDLEPLLDKPLRTRACLVFADKGSFMAYVNEHKMQDTAIFVSRDSWIVTALIDFHSPEQTSWCQHRAEYHIKASREFDQWRINENKVLTQREFAEFLEDRCQDIIEPRGADIMEMVMNLEGKITAHWESAIRTSNGEVQLRYHEEVETKHGGANKGNITVPQKLSLTIPIFHKEDARSFQVRLRYRVKEGKIVFWYQIVDHLLLLDDELEKIADSISQETRITAYHVERYAVGSKAWTTGI